MVKAFSVASWNVEHFKGDPDRVERVVKFLKKQEPDVFALYEVEGRTVFRQIKEEFPGYAFQITEGPQSQEILGAARSNLSPFFTQKLQFKAGTTHMRPGLLLSVTKGSAEYNLLFLHLASSTNPRGMGLRDEMLYRAAKFRGVLDDFAESSSGSRANYIFLGDLNTMGLEYPYGKDIDAKLELKKIDTYASRYRDLNRLTKTYHLTWSNGSGSRYDPSNLDHVYASEHLEFKRFRRQTEDDGSDSSSGYAEVSVRGWPELSEVDDRDEWIGEFSDHALLYFEVQKIPGS